MAKKKYTYVNDIVPFRTRAEKEKFIKEWTHETARLRLVMLKEKQEKEKEDEHI